MVGGNVIFDHLPYTPAVWGENAEFVRENGPRASLGILTNQDIDRKPNRGWTVELTDCQC
jgi:hypothetical protein